jgi:anti-sigma B factor antagonist
MRDENLTIEECPAVVGHRILRLTGPLVLNSFFAFQTLIREDQTDLLVLDFSAVPYIDSAGIGAMVGAYVHRQKDGRSMLLVGVQPRIRTALQVTKVEQFFRFSDSLPTVASASQ